MHYTVTFYSLQKDVDTDVKEDAWGHLVKSKFLIGLHKFLPFICYIVNSYNCARLLQKSESITYFEWFPKM